MHTVTLPIKTKIQTPNGWEFCDKLQINSEAISASGKKMIIKNVVKNDPSPIYRIWFNDNRYVDTVSTQSVSVWTKTGSEYKWNDISVKDLRKHVKTKRTYYPLTISSNTNKNKELNVLSPSEKMQMCERIGKYFSSDDPDETFSYLINHEMLRVPQIIKDSSHDEIVSFFKGAFACKKGYNRDGALIYKCKTYDCALDLSELMNSIGGIAKVEKNNQLYSVVMHHHFHEKIKRPMVLNKSIKDENRRTAKAIIRKKTKKEINSSAKSKKYLTKEEVLYPNNRNLQMSDDLLKEVKNHVFVPMLSIKKVDFIHKHDTVTLETESQVITENFIKI